MVRAVRSFKNLCAFFTHRSVLGIPLDLPLRAVVLAGLYFLLRRRFQPRASAAICLAVLLAKELFDIVAVQSLLHPRWPHLDDMADIASGLVGISLGLLISALRSPAREKLPPATS